jgi:hypothetical protein
LDFLERLASTLKDDLLERLGREGFLTVKGAGFRLIDEAITELVAMIN